jgi:hypothetical protein
MMLISYSSERVLNSGVATPFLSLLQNILASQLLPHLFPMSTPYQHPSDTSRIKDFEWDDKYDFPRDLVGYGENSFNPQWPSGAKIAVSFVINYEEVADPFEVRE